MHSVLVLSKSMFCRYFSNNSGFAILSSKTERPVWVCTAPDNWQLVIIAEGFSKDSSKSEEKCQNCFLFASACNTFCTKRMLYVSG